MANFAQISKPSKLILDKSPKYLKEDESWFLLNHDVNNVFGKATPMAANILACDMELGAGENYNVGRYYSALTNETYAWTYNSNGVNFIWRINGDGNCVIVYSGECLVLSADPKHSIEQWRAILDVDYLCNRIPGGKLKRLIWTDGVDKIHALDVEASISTNFFTTPFFDNCSDPCDYINLCVPEPSGCITGTWNAFTDADRGLPNKMLDKGFKFAYRYIYYDQRASELSDISSLYYQDARGCFDNSEGFSRCMTFRMPIGNPMVEKIEFYYSDDGGLTWFLADTIEKYKQYNSSQQYWYERDFTESVSSSFSSEDCSFDYVFCNDKQRIPADPKLISRVLNPIPREVQGIFRIQDSIAAYNYVLGNCPIDKNEAEKLQIELNCDDTTSCDIEMVKVVVRAIIYAIVSPTGTKGGYVFREGGVYQEADDVTDPAYFGEILGYDQNFNGETRNFIAYIEGTDYWVEMEQWASTPNFNTRGKIGIISGHSITAVANGVNQAIRNGNFFYQEGIMTVPKGTKGIVRLASHHAQNGLGLNQNTSTQVIGMLSPNGLKSYNGNTTFANPNQVLKEFYFDTCNGEDFEDFGAFIISSFAFNTYAGSYSGYITDAFSLPVEGALITADAQFKTTTDHNGFYKFVDNSTSQILIGIQVEQDCVSAFATIESFSALSDDKGVANVDYEIQSESYRDDFFAEIDVAVKDCNDAPVRGIRVAMTGNKYKITDVDGVAHFKLRNYSTRNRMARAIVMDRGGCFTLDCDDNCNPCMPTSANTLLAPCFLNTPDSTWNIATRINTASLNANKKGLKHGGRFALGFYVDYGCGKLSAVNEVKYIDIPSVQESGNLNYCSFDYDGGGINLPGAKRIVMVRSVNLSPYTLQWVVDDINRTTSGKITLTIQSLNDYNAQYNFKSNTIYKYLQGDRVEFIKNGDGTIFDSGTYGILNYAILSPFNDTILSGVTDDVNYFNQILITDDGKLDGLTEGAIIEIQPPSVSTQQVTYQSICASIPVDANGDLEIPIGSFNTFDTYLVSRQIAKFPAQFFESKTPSDFWGGTNLDDLGKAYFVNQFENEKRYERNISINSATQLNYFGDFIKTLDAVEQGYITAISVKDDKIGLALCKNDNFLFQISDDFLRVSSNGIVIAAPADSIISNPEAKIRGEYGCIYEDIGGILFGDGFATYPNSQNSAYIIHNYSIAQICGLSINQQNGLTETSCNSFFHKRMRQKANFNKTATNFLDHYRYSVGQNKINNVIYLTLKSLRHSGINNATSVYELPNDTIMYTPISDAFLGFASFTPEGYSELELNTDSGCALLSFQNSLPYIHPFIPDRWNEFYGEAVDELVGITISEGNKVIVPLSLEIQSTAMFFVHRVTTDNPTFLSEIPAIRFKRSNDKWNGALLNDINSRGGLYNGTSARSYYVNILFIKDNTLNLAYSTIDNSKRIAYNELDSILTKVMVSEQAGFEVNV